MSRRCVRSPEKQLAIRKIGGTGIAAGSRVLVIYASANRDEHEWDQPDSFDIRRDATRQMGFGYGSHACAGQGLARMETQAMLPRWSNASIGSS